MAKAKVRRGSSPAEVGTEWAWLLRLLPGYDPFRSTGGAWFEPDAARHAIEFIEECCHHVEGEKAGEPFLLEPWQKAFVANLFGWKRTDARGRVVRRYREALLYVARKNGKTPLAAAVALCVFFCDDEAGQQDYIAAADREQAGLLFRQCKGMIEQEPELSSRCRIYGGGGSAGQGRSIVREEDASYLRVISAEADTKHGGNSHLVIIDELHAQASRDLVDVLVTSTASLNRKQPLILYITTADLDRPSVCNETHDRACKARDADAGGPGDDPALLPAIWEATDADDWTDPAVWARVNPNLGVSVSEDYLARECEKAKGNTAYENTFKRLHVNVRTGQVTRVIPMNRWDACMELTYDLESLAGRECFGGLDLASTTDLASLALTFPLGDDRFATLVKFWAPRARARERGRADRVPYEAWAKEGWITLTEGDVIDYDVIRRDVNELNKVYFIRELAADRWNATQIITQLQGDGFTVFAFGQGFASMTAPTKKLLELIAAVRLQVGPNPVLRWQASNLACQTDAAENIKPTKAKSGDRIDGMVAITMSLGRALLFVTSVYDDRGMVMLGEGAPAPELPAPVPAQEQPTPPPGQTWLELFSDEDEQW